VIGDRVERGRLLARVAGIGGVSEVAAGGLRVVPRPHCAALGRLMAAAPPEMATPSGAVEEYAIGENMVFTITTPAFPAHLRVDYLTADGIVHHLVPSGLIPPARYPPDSTLRLGDGGRMTLTATGPPGADLLLVVAASAPVPDPPAGASDAGTYLPRLEATIRRLAAEPSARVEIAFVLVRIGAATLPDPPPLSSSAKGVSSP